MKLISLGPRFAAELRGVDLIDVATNDAAYCGLLSLSPYKFYCV